MNAYCVPNKETQDRTLALKEGRVCEGDKQIGSSGRNINGRGICKVRRREESRDFLEEVVPELK